MNLWREVRENPVAVVRGEYHVQSGVHACTQACSAFGVCGVKAGGRHDGGCTEILIFDPVQFVRYFKYAFPAYVFQIYSRI